MCSSGMRNMHRKLSCFSSGWQLPVHPALDAHLPTLLLLFSLYALIVAHFPPGYNPGLCLAANTKRHSFTLCLSRATDGARTRDPDLGKVVLYQLSHCRICCSRNLPGTNDTIL